MSRVSTKRMRLNQNHKVGSFANIKVLLRVDRRNQSKDQKNRRRENICVIFCIYTVRFYVLRTCARLEREITFSDVMLWCQQYLAALSGFLSRSHQTSQLSASSPSNRGLITDLQVKIYGCGLPCSNHIQVFWVTKHMLERRVILGRLPGHLQKIFLLADNINEACCRADMKADCYRQLILWSIPQLFIERQKQWEENNQFHVVHVQRT